jgi:hypothetical protein
MTKAISILTGLGITALAVLGIYKIVNANQSPKNEFYIQLVNPLPDTKWWGCGWKGNTGGPVKVGDIIKVSMDNTWEGTENSWLSIASYSQYGVDTFNQFYGGSHPEWGGINPFTPIAGALYQIDGHSTQYYNPPVPPDFTLVTENAVVEPSMVLPRADITIHLINAPEEVKTWEVWEVEMPDGGSMAQNKIASVNQTIKMNVPALCGFMGMFYREDGTRIFPGPGFDFDWCLNKDKDVFIYDYNTGLLTSYRQGDVNGDGKVSLLDVTWAEMVSLGQPGVTKEMIIRADINGDGIVDSSDINSLENILIGN